MNLSKTTSHFVPPAYLIPSSAIPQALGIIMCVWQVRLSEMRWQTWLIVLCCIMGLSALVSLVYAIWKRKEQDIPQPLILTLLIQGVCTFIGLIALTYPMPRPTYPLNLEVTLSLLGSLQTAGLCLLLCLKRGITASRREIVYGFLIPFGCAFGFSVWGSINLLTNTMLCLAVGTICLAALFLLRWAHTFFRPISAEVVIAQDTGDASAPAVDGVGMEAQYEGMIEAPEEAFAETSDAVPPKRRRFQPYKNTVFIAIFAFLFPIAGLGLNQAIGSTFLDASHPLFPIIALANGVLMLPAIRAKFRSLPFLYLQMIGFAYITYFTVIFMPTMAIGVLALLVGVGILILTPMILFLTELAQIMNLFKELRARHSAGAIGAVMLAGMLTLPALLGINAAIDRANYQNALAAVAGSGQRASVDTNRLTRTLNNMNEANAHFTLGMRGFRFGAFDLDWMGSERIPILSTAYGTFVYDALPVTSAVATDMYEIFYSGRKNIIRPDMSSWGITTRGFALKAYGVRTEFDEENGVYLSWVDLEIQNTLSGINDSAREFEASFHLPYGSFITDYYLYVGAENKQGLLSERRAANMVYESIVNRSKDPGILNYEDDETLRLRVFPFARGEVRKTGFRVMHIEPITLMIEGEPIALDTSEPNGARVHTPLDMGTHGLNCTSETCGEILPGVDNAYDNARILLHNAKVGPEDVERVWESFRRHVLSQATAFIVLESAEQEAALRILQQRILNGEVIPERFVSMDEPGVLVVAAIGVVILLLVRKRRGRKTLFTI